MSRSLPLVASIAIAMMYPATVDGQEAGLRATATRDDTKLSIAVQEQATTIDIVSPFGIDKATLHRTGDQWPKSLVICLHLKGLESFEAASGPVTLLASVPSTGEPVPAISLRRNGTETMLEKSSPYWTDVRKVGAQAKIPLADGHFEIPLPARLFEANPPSIQLRWVDFYRN